MYYVNAGTPPPPPPPPPPSKCLASEYFNKPVSPKAQFMRMLFGVQSQSLPKQYSRLPRIKYKVARVCAR